MPPLPPFEPVSIHAPREGSDQAVLCHAASVPISIHAPREGSDLLIEFSRGKKLLFQSTLPVRGATYGKSKQVARCGFQSTLPVRGATDALHVNLRRAEFQSTLPVRGATLALVFTTSTPGFQSTLPVRRATEKIRKARTVELFQSTLPVRGATGRFSGLHPACSISIHAPREGSGLLYFLLNIATLQFKSTRPGGRATRWARAAGVRAVFQSTLPARGATRWRQSPGGCPPHFNPRSPRGERPSFFPLLPGHSRFQSTLPARGATKSYILLN